MSHDPDSVTAIEASRRLAKSPADVQGVLFNKKLKGRYHPIPKYCVVDKEDLDRYIDRENQFGPLPIEMNDDRDPTNAVAMKVKDQALPNKARNDGMKIEMNRYRDSVTAIEASRRLGKSPAHVQALLFNKTLKGRYHRFPKWCRVNRKDLDRYISEGNNKEPNPGGRPTKPSPIKMNDYPDPMNAIQAARILRMTPAEVQTYLMNGNLRGRYHPIPSQSRIRRRDLTIFQRQYLAPSQPVAGRYRERPIHPR